MEITPDTPFNPRDFDFVETLKKQRLSYWQNCKAVARWWFDNLKWDLGFPSPVSGGSGLRCDVEKHLWRSGLKLAIYKKLAGLTWVKSRQEYGTYHSSLQNLADYFGLFHQSIQRAISEMVNEDGWLEYVEPKRKAVVGVATLRAEIKGHKDLRVVTHDEWLKRHPDAKCCFVPDAMPWDSEKKDPLALALHRESKGNVKWHPNLLKALRKTGQTDAQIEAAYHSHVQAMEFEPKKARGWQSNAFRFVALFH